MELRSAAQFASDKTFFFASWEGFRQVNPTVSSTRVPTDAERAQVVDPISKNLLQFWPAPNSTRAGSTINYIANVSAATFDNTGLIKIDHNFSDRDHLTGRWAEYQGTAITAGVLPSLGGTSNAPISRSGVLTETHTFAPTLLNEFRFGFSRNLTFLTVTDSGFNAQTVFLGANGKPLPGVVNGSQNVLDSGLPTITRFGRFRYPRHSQQLPAGSHHEYLRIVRQRELGRSFRFVRSTPSAGVSTYVAKKPAGFSIARSAAHSTSRAGQILPLAKSIHPHSTPARRLHIGGGTRGISTGRTCTR